MSDDPVLAALGRLEEGQTRFQEGLTRLEGSQAKLEENQTRLQEGQTRLRVDVMDRLDRHEDRLTKLETGQSQLRADMMGRFEHVENRLGEIRDDIGVNIGRADHADTSARAARDELKTMWRMIQKLQTRVDGLEKR